MPPIRLVWSPETGLVAAAIGVVLTNITILGSSMVAESLQRIASQYARARTAHVKVPTLDTSLRLEAADTLLLEFSSTAILFKFMQSVGLAYYVGAVFSAAGIAMVGAYGNGSVAVTIAALLTNASFLLVVLPLVLTVLAYMAHRVAENRLRGVQESLHLIRLRFFARC